MYCNSRRSRSRHTSDPFPGVASIFSAQLRGLFAHFSARGRPTHAAWTGNRGSSGLDRRWNYSQFAGSCAQDRVKNAVRSAARTAGTCSASGKERQHSGIESRATASGAPRATADRRPRYNLLAAALSPPVWSTDVVTRLSPKCGCRARDQGLTLDESFPDVYSGQCPSANCFHRPRAREQKWDLRMPGFASQCTPPLIVRASGAPAPSPVRDKICSLAFILSVESGS